MAATVEREHKWAAPPIFSERHDLPRWSADDLEAIAHTLNNRPRKALKWRTSAEVIDEQLHSIKQTRCCIDRFELAQYTSTRLTQKLSLEHISAPICSVGDAYDNALIESASGLYKTECIGSVS